MVDDLSIRMADPRDAATIAEFNIAMAWETENRELPIDVISAGVEGVFTNPHVGFYVVAERGGVVVGSLLVTPEWSDWRNGVFWWIQSVYIKPEHRRQGIYRRLYAYVKARAVEQGNVCGFRLYVEKDNTVALRAYEKLGMEETHYRMYEEGAS